MDKSKLLLNPKRLLAICLLSFSLILFSDNALAFGNLDDCGTLRLTRDGCLVFAPDHHAGIYTLDNYADFGPGDQVHVSGNHDPSYFCGCQSRCLRQNTIVQGCSTLCTGVASDANNDGRMNIADVGVIIMLIFSGGDALVCKEQGDCNGNGRIDIGDVTCIIAKIF